MKRAKERLVVSFHYRSVISNGKTLVAIVLEDLKLPLTEKETLLNLEKQGFHVFASNEVSSKNVSVYEKLFTVSLGLKEKRYRRGARQTEAPGVFDCSSFSKYVMASVGIWIPRRSIQQFHTGVHVDINDVDTGDLVFTSGFRDYYTDDPSLGVGHVGIVFIDALTGEPWVQHAANSRKGVIDTPLEEFIGKGKGRIIFRGVKRVIPRNKALFILECPPEREVETSDDLRWIIYQNLSL